MDLVNSAAKLEPFLLISKSAKGAAAAKLIQDATSAPGVFVFAELLQLPNIQAVRIDLATAYLPISCSIPPARFERTACFLLLLASAIFVQDVPGLHPCAPHSSCSTCIAQMRFRTQGVLSTTQPRPGFQIKTSLPRFLCYATTSPCLVPRPSPNLLWSR